MKTIHDATYPAKTRKPKPAAARAAPTVDDMLDALDAEAAEEAE
ncbi:hypothetical protein [Metallibacterium sp.]|nr:hypothetical protein [Metallibacterium sp.]